MITLQKMDTSPNRRPNVVDETTNLHVHIDNKDELSALVKDSLEEAIIMENFEKSLELLEASNSTKCNIISNRTYLFIPKHSSIPKVCT